MHILFQFIDVFEMETTKEELWVFVKSILISQGLEAHQLPADKEEDCQFTALLTLALRQTTRQEV